MKFKQLATSTLKTNEALLWNKQPLYKKHAPLRGYLIAKLGAGFEHFFAQPILDKKGGVIKGLKWGTEDKGTIFSTYKEICEKAENDNRKKIEEQVESVKQFIVILSDSGNEEDKEWTEMLKKCLSSISDEHIFFDGDRVVLTNWGLKSIPPTPIFPFELGSKTKATRETEPSSEEEEADTSQDTEEPDNINDDPSREKFPSDVETKNEESEEENTEGDTTEEGIIEEPVDDEKGISSEGPAEGTEPIPPENGSNKAKTNGDTKKEKDENSNLPPDNTNKRWDIFKCNWWWWLLLLLLLLLILFLLTRFETCKNPITYLPENPGLVVPVDSSELTIDGDSLRIIAGDRLNIALKGANKDIEAFAVKFKTAYPDEQYSIIYYDTLISLIQIKIPTSEREQLIKEIPKKIPEFDMLVWHESIFTRDVTPSDPGFQDASKSWFLEVIQANVAWSTTYGSDSVLIAIADDGFDLNHPELAGRHLYERNSLNRSNDVFTYKASIHGSHVAGLAIGNKNNNSGVSGVAPDCKFVPIQVSSNKGIMSSTAIVDAILYGINQKVDVINLSLGMKFSPVVATFPVSVQRDMIANILKDEEAFWNELFDLTQENNVVVVIAAGNDNVLAGLDPMQRSANTIKVSAVNFSLRKASFSNYGDFTSISAPGQQIYSSIPNGQFEYLDGSSMAAPLVAGAVALIRSIKPDMSPSDIKNLLVNTGRVLSSDIGPLLQLGTALSNIDNPNINPPNDNCADVQNKIDELMAEIERLRTICPNIVPIDTMRMPEVIDNLDFCLGRWRSTSYLHNDAGEKITLFFDFLPQSNGLLTLLEPDGTLCKAPLSLQVINNEFDVNQLEDAFCDGTNTFYTQYTFTCAADSEGYAQCVAENKLIKANRILFKLVKVQ